MRTPKRHNGDLPLANIFAQRHSRWKRKNRIKQLKNTIQKYKDGTMLPKLKPIRLAYKWIQELEKPKADAPVTCWCEYLSKVKSISSMINIACEDAAVCFGVALEREERKVQQ